MTEHGGALIRALVGALLVAGCTQGGSTPTPSPPGSSAPTHTAAASPSSSPVGDGSIVYVAGWNVWLSGPDASFARQLTTDGTEDAPYHDPTQSDSGAVFALRGGRALVEIDRAGSGPRGTINLATLENGAEGLSISPDGGQIAYATTGFGTEIDPRFGTPTGTFLYGGTDIASAGGESIPGAALPTLLFPSWRDAAHLVAGDGVTIWWNELGHDAVSWLSVNEGCVIELDCPSGTPTQANFSTPAISPEGSLLAYNYKPYFGEAGRAVVRLTSPPPAAPEVGCLMPDQEDNSDPGTFAPDGSAFAYDDTRFDPDGFETVIGQGIWLVELDVAAADCGAAAARLVVPGGAQPDWGPAAP